MTALKKIDISDKVQTLRAKFAPLKFNQKIITDIVKFMMAYKEAMSKLSVAPDWRQAKSLYEGLLSQHQLSAPQFEDFKKAQEVVKEFVDQHLLLVMDSKTLALFNATNLEEFLLEIKPLVRNFSNPAKTMIGIEIADRILAFNYVSQGLNHTERKKHKLGSTEELTKQMSQATVGMNIHGPSVSYEDTSLNHDLD